MLKIYFSILFLSTLSINCFSQNDTGRNVTVDSNKESFDSIAFEKELRASFDSLPNKASSYFQVGFGIGNQLFSVHNHALDAKQSTPPLVFTPTIGYFNKSGFNIVANDYLLRENKTFGANQYSITPGYETPYGSNFDFLFTYTHYFVNNEYSVYSSPVQNDFYSSLTYKNTWLQPGFALGYSSGESKAVVHLDTVINAKERDLYDSTTSNLKSFSMILSVQHAFGWGAVLNKSDSISFIPILMLNLGSSKDSITSIDNLTAILRALLQEAKIKSIRNNLTKKINKLNKLQATAFEAQSLGLDLEGSYSIGNFAIQPSVYFDYFLPQTTQKRLTEIFNINFSYAF